MSVSWHLDDGAPLGTGMDPAPGVGVPRQREHCIVVGNKELHREDDQKHREAKEKEPQKARLVVAAVGGVEDFTELAAVFLETIEDNT